jgi:hypothetical protein
MREVFQKIASMIMAFVVLFSTMSFTIDMHYCGDTLVDTAIFKEAKSCGMEMQKASESSQCSITKKNCCSDKQIIVEGQNELTVSFDNISFDQQLFVASFVYSYINLFNAIDENVTSFSEYPPPLIIKRIYKLDETYLI